jgi:hypothetical protein
LLRGTANHHIAGEPDELEVIGIRIGMGQVISLKNGEASDGGIKGFVKTLLGFAQRGLQS